MQTCIQGFMPFSQDIRNVYCIFLCHMEYYCQGFKVIRSQGFKVMRSYSVHELFEGVLPFCFAAVQWFVFLHVFQIHFVLLISRQGKVRLTKWYSPYSQKERTKVFLINLSSFYDFIDYQCIVITIISFCFEKTLDIFI